MSTQAIIGFHIKTDSDIYNMIIAIVFSRLYGLLHLIFVYLSKKSMIFIITALLLIILTPFYVFFKYKFSYWKQRNVQFAPPSFPFGNLGCPLTRTQHLGVTFKQFYLEAKSRKLKHFGLFSLSQPTYLAIDLNAIRQILVGNFEDFSHRGVYYNERDDPLTGHLFAIENPKWKPLRDKINASFTPCKLKSMFEIIKRDEEALNVSDSSGDALNINIKDLVANFTAYTIGHCTLGLDFKSIENSRKFRDKLFTRVSAFQQKFRILRRPFVTAYPNFARFLRIRLIETESSEFFIDMVRKNLEFAGYNKEKRDDLVGVLKNIQGLSDEEIAAHCYIFYLAGFETPAIVMAFALYELARNQAIQDRIRNEIGNRRIDYEFVNNFKYLDQVINETLRQYPPSPYLTRRCTKDCIIQDLKIEKDTFVIVPVLGIHYDDQFYPDPDTFNPDRFSDDNRSLRANYTFLPFGEGPRKCIGFRFGKLQIKIGLISLLKTYKFSINSRTKQPLKLKVDPTLLGVEGEIWLDAQKL